MCLEPGFRSVGWETLAEIHIGLDDLKDVEK